MMTFINKHNLLKKVLPKNSKVSLISSIIAAIVSLLFSILIYVRFSNGEQIYNDIVAGNITIPGIYKEIDFISYYVFFISYIFIYFCMNIYLGTKDFFVKEINDGFNKGDILVGLFPVVISIVLKMGSLSTYQACFIAYYLLMVLYLKLLKLDNNLIVKICIFIYSIYLTLSGVLAVLTYYKPDISDKLVIYFYPFLFLIYLTLSVYLFINQKKIALLKDKLIDLLILVSQLLIPLNLFSLINTRYYYNGNQYILHNQKTFQNLILILVLILICENVFLLVKYLKSNIKSTFSIVTIITFVAVNLWNSNYNFLIDTDQFHTGETAVVFQQITEYGMKWNKEFVSVLQGLGYILSGLNELLFNGTFATYVQTQNFFMVLIAIITSIILYFIIDKKWLLLFICPIMPLFWMNRTYLIVPVYLLLICKKIISKPILWSYLYIITCILHVWYQPTYGGAVAASLLPVFIYIWYNEIKNNNIKKYKTNILILFLISVILIAGLCVPMLLDIFYFLRTNGFETKITNGVSIKQTILSQPLFFTGITKIDLLIQTVVKFGSGIISLLIMIYMFFTHVISQENYEKKIQGMILTLSTALSYILMLPAIFTRIDPGISRIGATGAIYFGFLNIILLYIYWNEIKIKKITMIISGFALCVCLYTINQYPQYFDIHKKANNVVYIPDDAIYVEPSSTGMDNLGYSFLNDPNYIHEATTLNKLCQLLLKDNQTYYDMTDKSIYYLFTNKKVPGIYASPLVASNKLIQKDVIKSLEKNDIPIVFINKPLRYIGVSESIRVYRIFRYFLQKDYKYVRYNGCDFLIRGDVDLKPIQNEIEIFDISNEIGVYDSMINNEIYDSNLIEKIQLNNISYTHNVIVNQNQVQIIGDDPFIIYDSFSNVNLKNISLVEIILNDNNNKDLRGQLFVQTSVFNHNETNTIHFNMSNNKILIPIYKYSQFDIDSELINIRLDFDNVKLGDQITLESINLYTMDINQINDFEHQYTIISSSLTDNRLNEIFHQPDLGYLPIQWGQNFHRMKSDFRLEEQSKAIYYDNSKTEAKISFNKELSGDKFEYLKMDISISENEEIKSTIFIRGIDENGNFLSEAFNLVICNGSVLIPIGSSPNCLRAKSINNVDILFEENNTDINISNLEVYSLIE